MGCCCSGQHDCLTVFLEEPGNGGVFVPVNSSQTLSCSVIEEYIISSWLFQLRPDSLVFALSVPAILSIVQRDFQIDLTEISERMSIVTLNVTDELNETRLTCVAVGESIEEREALLIVYGMKELIRACMIMYSRLHYSCHTVRG